MKHSLNSRFIASILGAATLIPGATAVAQHQATEDFDKPAHFRVTSDVVSEDIPAFTATIGAVGNSLLRGTFSYEPLNWRCQWSAAEDATGKVVVGSQLSWYNTLGDGFLDGGFVRVYRVVDGKMTLVVNEQIVEDGFVLRDWMGGDLGKVVPAGSHTYRHKWAPWERPNVPYYFAVAAVDTDGNISEKSEPLELTPPENFKDATDANNETVKVKANKESDGAAPAAPQNLRSEFKDGMAEITWDAVEADDLAGYVMFFSDYAPATHEGHFIRLADSSMEIKQGDMVIAGKRLASFASNIVSNRVHGADRQMRSTFDLYFPFQDEPDEGITWELVEHEDGTPVTDPGETFLQLKLDAGKEFAIAEYTHAGTNQDWYDVIEPGKEYKVEVWLKYEGEGEGKATFSVAGTHEDEIQPATFTPGAEWQKFETTFSVAEMATGGHPSQSKITLVGPGTYSVDNFRIYQSDTAFLDLLPRDYERLEESGMRMLRTHGPIKTGHTTYSMDQYTNAGGVIRGIKKGNTLPQILSIMRKAEQLPWLQIEFHMSPEEWLGFAEYMAAPYDPAVDSPESKPWAAKRHAQGQAEPWVNEFDTFYFELANETWNGLFKPWVFDSMVDHGSGEKLDRGYVYGLFQEHVRDILRSSPYWTPELDEKFIYVIGGWGGSSYGFEAGKASPNSKYITNAAYNGGWDEGEGPPQTNPISYFNVLAQVNQTAIPRAVGNRELIAEVNEGREQKAELGVYEAGPGYAMNGLNNAKVSKDQARQQELVMKSMTSGTATLDTFLARAYHNFRVDNFFTFSEGDRWSSHAKWYRGGQAYPQWATLAVFNNHGTGDFLKVETESVPTIDLPGFRRRDAVEDAPLAAAYVTRKGDRLTLFVISRKIPNYPKEGDAGFIPVTVDLPITGADKITLHKLSGDHTAQNVDSHEVSIETVEIPAAEFQQSFKVNAATGADDQGLPPASSFIYVFDGVKS